MKTLFVIFVLISIACSQNVICISGLGVSVFNEMTRTDCQALHGTVLTDSHGNQVTINLTHIIMNGNPGGNNESVTYNLTMSLIDTVDRTNWIPIVIQAISRARNGWFIGASQRPEAYWINLRGSPLELQLPPNNTIWNIFNEFAVWYIKGFIAASFASTTDYFVVVIPENFTATYVNNANAYLAGLKSVNPNATLYVIDTAGNFGGGGNEQLVMNRIKSIETSNGIFFPVIAHLQSLQAWPNITLAEGRKLIENQYGVNSPSVTINNLIGSPHVLVTTVWDHNLLFNELLQKAALRTFHERETIYISKNSDDDLILDISEISNLVPKSVRKDAKKLRNKFLTKDFKNNILCEPDVVDQLRDAYLVINECIQTDSIVYRTQLSPKIIHLPLNP